MIRRAMEIALRLLPARDELQRQARLHWYEGAHWFEAFIRAEHRIEALEKKIGDLEKADTWAKVWAVEQGNSESFNIYVKGLFDRYYGGTD